MENDRVGMHIINKWPENALKVLAKTLLQPNQWYHVIVTYDGSGKAAGVKVYINGVAQTVEVFADKLTADDSHARCPSRSASAIHATACRAAMAAGRAALRPRSERMEVEQLAKGTRAPALLAKPADKRNAKETTELFDWWLVALDQPSRDLRPQAWRLVQRGSEMRSAAAPSPTS